MDLYPHQRKALEFLKTRPKALICLDAGLGKTAIAIKTFKPKERILVICPATLKLNWEREIEMWMDSPPEIKIIKSKNDYMPRTGIIIINYDLLGTRSNRHIIPLFDFSKFDRVVVDEFHRIKNQSAIRTKITAKIIYHTPNAVLLSGTPGERSAHLYVPLYSVGATKMKWLDFAYRYCDPKKVFLGRKEIMKFDGATNTDELRAMMNPVSLIMKKEDVIDLPDKIISVIALDLAVGFKEKQYSLFDILEDRRPLGFEGLAELLHEQGMRKVPLAVSHIKMRLEEHDKIFIVCQHRDVIDALTVKLKDFYPLKLDGRSSLKEKQHVVDQFQNDTKYRVFIGQIRAAGVGITLTSASLVIFVETNWSYSDLSQCIDRLHRIGQKNTVYAEILAIADSIDYKVLHKTLQKAKFVKDVLY